MGRKRVSYIIRDEPHRYCCSSTPRPLRIFSGSCERLPPEYLIFSPPLPLAAATTPSADRLQPSHDLDDSPRGKSRFQESQGPRRGRGHGHAGRHAAGGGPGVRDQPRRGEGVGEGRGRAAVLLRARGGGGQEGHLDPGERRRSVQGKRAY